MIGAAPILPKTRVWGSDLLDPSKASGEPPLLAAFRIWPRAGVTTTTRRAVPDYLRARYYDPSTGQFLSRDPLVAQTRDPYAYAGDNPLNATDPMGLCVWNDFGCFAGNLGALPGAVAGDFGQGQENFVVNIQSPLGLGVVLPLAGAATIATGGLIWEGTIVPAMTSGGAVSAAAMQASQVEMSPGCTQGQMNMAQQALNSGGVNGLLRSQVSIQALLAEHQQALAQYQAEGGFTSVTQKEIANFQGQLVAIQHLLDQQ